MKCPRCQANSRVMRTMDNRRRRTCPKCHNRFTTFEVTAEERTSMAADSVLLARARGLLNEGKP